MTAFRDGPIFRIARSCPPAARRCAGRGRAPPRSAVNGEVRVDLLDLAAVTIPFRSEIMELPLVALTMLFCFGALVVLGRWWER